jgi:hypothetical protein
MLRCVVRFGKLQNHLQHLQQLEPCLSFRQSRRATREFRKQVRLATPEAFLKLEKPEGDSLFDGDMGKSEMSLTTANRRPASQNVGELRLSIRWRSP